MIKPCKALLQGTLKPNGVLHIDVPSLADRMKTEVDLLNTFKAQQEQNIKKPAAVLYVDTGREPKMWDINTPMPVKGDSQILAHFNL